MDVKNARMRKGVTIIDNSMSPIITRFITTINNILEDYGKVVKYAMIQKYVNAVLFYFVLFYGRSTLKATGK